MRNYRFHNPIIGFTDRMNAGLVDELVVEKSAKEYLEKRPHAFKRLISEINEGKINYFKIKTFKCEGEKDIIIVCTEEEGRVFMSESIDCVHAFILKYWW